MFFNLIQTLVNDKADFYVLIAGHGQNTFRVLRNRGRGVIVMMNERKSFVSHRKVKGILREDV